MALLKQTNPIVTTYPMYIVPYGEDYSYNEIYSWLLQYTKHIGIGRTTYGTDYSIAWRVYAKLDPQVESLFILKFNAKLYYKKAIIPEALQVFVNE